MKKFITITSIGILFSMFMVVQSFAAEGAKSSSQQQSKSNQMQKAEMSQGQEHYFRSSMLVGQEVKNTHGQKIGTIKDVVISGFARPQYLVIAAEGSDKLVPVPMDRAHVQIQQGQVVAEISQEQIKNAPSFSENQWPNFAEKNYEHKVNAYYSSGKKQGGQQGQQQSGKSMKEKEQQQR